MCVTIYHVGLVLFFFLSNYNTDNLYDLKLQRRRIFWAGSVVNSLPARPSEEISHRSIKSLSCTLDWVCLVWGRLPWYDREFMQISTFYWIMQKFCLQRNKKYYISKSWTHHTRQFLLQHDSHKTIFIFFHWKLWVMKKVI